MNNAISILIDSVLWEATGTKRTKVSTTPFIDSLKNEGVTASKLYSQGPYTDAATKGVYTGRNTLDDFSYYFKLNTSPTNHFKVFKDNGYETYGFYYPYYMVGTEMKRSIDHVIYTSGFAYVSEWGGVFSYYVDAKKNRSLSEDEYCLLKHRINLMFDVWIGFYEDIQINQESTILIKEEIGTFDIEYALKILRDEETLFQNDTKGYINHFLEKGKSHVLVTLDRIDVDKHIDRNKLSQIYREYSNFFKQSETNNIKANIWRNRPGLFRIFRAIYKCLKEGDKDGLKFIKNYYRCLTNISTVKYDSYKPLWQLLPSARREFNGAIEVLRNRNSEKAFYLSMHILDPHSFISFFSYDMLERDIIDEEFDMLSKFVKELGTGFMGSLPYYLSIRYVDFCLEKFCEELKNMGLWENTSLLLFADHGSSCSFYPLHNTSVNCFDDECYHVPVLIRHPGFKGIDIKSYHNSIDVFPTFYDLLGLKTPSCIKGKSMLDQTCPAKPYVMTEYMGPGCPDMTQRPIWFSIRDEHYIIAYKVGVYQAFEEGDMCEVYELNKDPKGYHNIHNSIDKEKISYLLQPLKDRFEEIRHDVNDFLQIIRQSNVVKGI